MIEAVSGVLLDGEDAAFLAGALEQFGKVLAERGSQPTARLESLQRRLSRVSTRVSALDTHVGARDSAPQQDSGVQLGYELIDSARAADILGITPDGARDLARRGKVRAARTAGRWVFDAGSVVARAEHRR